mmetsp:Transcript_28274/g.69940  ORF Transcript_28274/g.69940 Transcript_28274/m.69940 type:complete len:90 (+) Transcript_28274:234-503(+)
MCGESVRGTDALRCTKCPCNSYHQRHAAEFPAWADQCPQCMQSGCMAAWDGSFNEAGAASDTIDLTCDMMGTEDQARPRVVPVRSVSVL